MNRLDARLAVHAVGADRDLPAEPGARIDPERLQRQRHQPGGDLLAGRDDNVVFARVVQPADQTGPVDELVGRAGHRRNDDGNLVAGIDLALDPTGGIRDLVDVGDRRSAEFLNDARHLSLVMRYPLHRNACIRDRRLMLPEPYRLRILDRASCGRPIAEPMWTWTNSATP